MNHNYYIYTDASFDKKRQLAMAGFFIFDNDDAHQVGLSASSLISTSSIYETNNIRAEFRAVLAALEALAAKPLEDNFIITLYTDCQAISKLLARREKLVASQYLSQKKGTVLPNADLYQAFYRIYDQLKPKIIWLKGHSAAKNQSFIQKNFSMLDKAVRKALRGASSN